MGKGARRKGHQFERDMATLLRPVHPEVKTTRLAAPELDPQGQDLANTGAFIYQCKAVEALNVHKVLSEMPKQDGKINAVASKKNRQGTLIAISADDWLKILALLPEDLRKGGVVVKWSICT